MSEKKRFVILHETWWHSIIKDFITYGGMLLVLYFNHVVWDIGSLVVDFGAGIILIAVLGKVFGSAQRADCHSWEELRDYVEKVKP